MDKKELNENSRGRKKAIEAELEKIMAEYLAKKENFEKAQVAFEATKQKFASLRRLAADMLSPGEWAVWQIEHQNVEYAGVPIGEAIVLVLRGRAWMAAGQFIEGKTARFMPAMNMYAITEALEKGNFEFRTPTPLREVNAALRHLKGITRLSSGAYHIEDATQVLEQRQETAKRREQLEKASKT